MKATIIRFVNSMIMGTDFDGFTLLRSDLTCQHFSEKYEEAVKLVEYEVAVLTSSDGYTVHKAGSSTGSDKLIRPSASVDVNDDTYMQSASAKVVRS